MKPEKRIKYPIFGFRISEEDKAELEQLIKKHLERLNRGIRDDERPFKINEVILEAIKEGLPRLKRE